MLKHCLILLVLLVTVKIIAEDLPIDVYELPDEAIKTETLNMIDGRVFLNANPFTGISYERYKNDKLKSVVSYKKGMLNGPTFEWYESGEKLLSANYKLGKLNGNYSAWYENGVYIYNLMFKDGKLNYDTQLSNDDSREESDIEDAELDAEPDNEVKGK